MNKILILLTIILIINWINLLTFTNVKAQYCRTNCLDFYITVQCEQQTNGTLPPLRQDLAVRVNAANTTIFTDYYMHLQDIVSGRYIYNVILIELPNLATYHYRFMENGKFISDWQAIVVPATSTLVIMDNCSSVYLPLIKK